MRQKSLEHGGENESEGSRTKKKRGPDRRPA